MGARPRSPSSALAALLALSACALALSERPPAKTRQQGSNGGKPDVLIHIANSHWLGDEYFQDRYSFVARQGRTSKNLSCVFTETADTAATADAIWCAEREEQRAPGRDRWQPLATHTRPCPSQPPPRYQLATGPQTGPFGSKYKPRADQIGVEFTLESYPMQECQFGRHMLQPSVRNNFDVKMSYRKDADVWVPYYLNVFKDYWEAHPPLPFTKKKDAIVGMHSNCAGTCIPLTEQTARFLSKHTLEELEEPSIGRDDMLTGLMEAVDLPFHFYGKCLSNRPHVPRDMKPPTHFADRNKLAMFKRYKFCATFENSVDDDYVSEKVFLGLMAGCLPIYFGAPNIDEYIPSPDAVVDAAKFKSRDDLARFIHHLADNETAYEERMAWRRQGPAAWSPAFAKLVAYVGDEAGYHQPNVRLCKRVHEIQEQRRLQQV